jgi:hypothetical protein
MHCQPEKREGDRGRCWRSGSSFRSSAKMENCRLEKMEGEATGGTKGMTRWVDVLEKWPEMLAIDRGGGEPPVGEEGVEWRSDEAGKGAEARQEVGGGKRRM